MVDNNIGDRVGDTDDKLINAVMTKLGQGTSATDTLKLEVGALVRALVGVTSSCKIDIACRP